MATQQQIDLRALALYALDVLDCHPDYEDDEFAITFQGTRVYVERRADHFLLHIGRDRHQLPRC